MTFHDVALPSSGGFMFIDSADASKMARHYHGKHQGLLENGAEACLRVVSERYNSMICYHQLDALVL